MSQILDGNRHENIADWALDQFNKQYPTIREKFDTYRFADYKEKVIDVLMRVTHVSVTTQVIVEAMKAASRRLAGAYRYSGDSGAATSARGRLRIEGFGLEDYFLSVQARWGIR
jgi:hypothetical protein